VDTSPVGSTCPGHGQRLPATEFLEHTLKPHTLESTPRCKEHQHTCEVWLQHEHLDQRGHRGTRWQSLVWLPVTSLVIVAIASSGLIQAMCGTHESVHAQILGRSKQFQAIIYRLHCYLRKELAVIGPESITVSLFIFWGFHRPPSWQCSVANRQKDARTLPIPTSPGPYTMNP